MEDLNDKIKLPSNWMLVNAESIWKYLTTISKTGKVFTREQLIKNNLYTSNEDNISRNLSYLKYLGIIDEERAKGKDQRFKVVDSKTITDLLYELKAGREDSAKNQFRLHLENHVLFITINHDFFAGEETKTLNELEHFLKDGMPGKTPTYYQKGGEFLIKLLQFVSLTTLNGNDITVNSNTPLPLLTPDKPNDFIADNQSDTFTQNVDQRNERYSVKIKGPGINLEVAIKNTSHLNLVQSLINTIKEELENANDV